MSLTVKCVFSRRVFMSRTKAAFPRRVTALSTPPYQFSNDLLDAMLATLPPLVAYARPARHRTLGTWFDKGGIVLHPTDAAPPSPSPLRVSTHGMTTRGHALVRSSWPKLASRERYRRIDLIQLGTTPMAGVA
jgi:hypothetical protein